jgi:hypothetical protein
VARNAPIRMTHCEGQANCATINPPPILSPNL